MKQTYKTWCPLFPGFYETIYEADETCGIESYNEEYKTELKYDDFNFDYKAYEKEVSEQFVNKLESELSYIIPVQMSFEAVKSPKEYNFRNDSINIELTVDLGDLQRIISENRDKAIEYFKDHYTSCSGFISFHSNDIEDWLNPEYINENQEHRIGALLECICVINEIDYFRFDVNGHLDAWPKETSEA